MTKQEIKEKVIEIRHNIHRRPELAMKEYETQKYIRSIMEEYGFDCTDVGGTGLVATLKCGDGDKMIGLRADIDALPIKENTGLPYTSEIDGVFHGCGHDSHIASLIGAALLLKESQDFNGTVCFVFQPGEEPGLGAKAMIADGLFEKFPMQEIYGCHNNATATAGQILTRPGIMMSSEDDWWITIRGKGGHASRPHVLRDPLVTAGQLLVNLQTVVSRSVNPQEAGTCSACDISTDGAMNAVPSTVKLLGDCRSYNPEVSKLIEKRMGEIIKSTCEMNGCEYEFRYDRVFTSVNNDEECYKAVLAAAEKVVGKENVNPMMERGSGSEDFAWYQQIIPGCYFNVGIMPEGTDPADVYPVHNAKYVYNDDAILCSSEVFAQIVRDRLI